MHYYGYHRTSTKEQHLDRGLKELEEYASINNIKLEKIFTDQQTGKNFNRPRYIVLKEDVLKKGDTLIVTEIDRLGRNKQDTLKELQYFKENGIRVMILEIPTTLMDFSKTENTLANLLTETINNMLIEMYASLAQAEMEKNKKRQREGIEAMKERGEWENYGRPKAIEDEEFAREYQKVIKGEMKPFELMEYLGLTEPTYYRYRKNYLEKTANKFNS